MFHPHLLDTFRKAHRISEEEAVAQARFVISQEKIEWAEVEKQAKDWIENIRAKGVSPFSIEGLMQTHKLGSPEGLSLMELAEAYLRIPDSLTKDQFLKDQLNKGVWNFKDPNADVISKLSHLGLTLSQKLLNSPFNKLIKNPFRFTYSKVIQTLSHQFVLAETIQNALTITDQKYIYSFDMLGEAARSERDALRYFESYKDALLAIEDSSQNSLSVKLSALYARFEWSRRDDVFKILYPRILDLCLIAKEKNVDLTIDAEESERLELTLEIITKLRFEESLKGWSGLGFALQAYQKRALPALRMMLEVAQRAEHPFKIRLVKGAYWDSEVKRTQVNGLRDYPVFTQKHHTDLNYWALAIELMSSKHTYPQFATHNAVTLSLIAHLFHKKCPGKTLEVQRLHGMGEELHALFLGKNRQCRIYAPIGTFKDLLAYLVRRLLENGANSGFLNQLYDKTLPVSNLVASPDHGVGERHPNIKAPRDQFGGVRLSARGFDLSDPLELEKLGKSVAVLSLLSRDVDLEKSQAAFEKWKFEPTEARVGLVNKLADLMESKYYLDLLNILGKEGQKTYSDAVSEVREAIDFCRYYAHQAESLVPVILPGPTGERNELSYHPRGVFVCVSPWNFPLAIFLGQAVAALVTGNAVIAKPASQTPKIALFIEKLIHEAEFPKDLFQVSLMKGSDFANTILPHPYVKGVAFTGSLDTARSIQKRLFETHEALLPFIAETGGINAMVVDSSVLPEQAVQDIITSSFQSAGQRCSALRFLLVQEDIKDDLLEMLKGAMDLLNIGDPMLLETDIGPVIDETAKEGLQVHSQYLSTQAWAKCFYTCSISEDMNLFPPQVWEIDSIERLEKEVFGPILHVVSYKANELENIIQKVNNLGYGLTFGLHSRLESTIQSVKDRANVGNLYVNRSQIGAVVGVQPFGGEGLSGTGPKAGGPHYLHKFVTERVFTRDTTASGGNITLLSGLS